MKKVNDQFSENKFHKFIGDPRKISKMRFVGNYSDNRPSILPSYYIDGRDLRYYRIGIKNTILLSKSIVSVSYQYRNSVLEKYHYRVSVSKFQTSKYQYQYRYHLLTFSVSSFVSVLFLHLRPSK